MIIAKVVGNVVATHKNRYLTGHKLLLVQQMDLDGSLTGVEMIAADGVGAGIGDVVVALAEGGSAREIILAKSPLTPVDLCIAGIVDSFSTEQ